MSELQYLSGFGNQFSSEAVPGTTLISCVGATSVGASATGAILTVTVAVEVPPWPSDAV